MHAIPAAIGTSLDWKAPKVSVDVLRKGLNRGVAIGRPLLHRFEHNRVEVATQGARGGQVACVACRRTRAWYLDRKQCLFERGRRLTLQAIGPRAGQHLIEQHTQRIDVAGRADGRAGDLLGRGVVGRQRLTRFEGQLGGLGLAIDQQLGDAEVQQVHLTLFVDQHVGGLEVAVDHQVRVRILHRFEHLLEQSDAFAHAESMRAAMLDQRVPLHIGQRDVGLARSRHARVVQARDMRMRQRGQDVALARQPLGECARGQAGVRQLERHLALEQAISSLGQPHAAHAAAADLAQQPIGADHALAVVGCNGFGLVAAVRAQTNLGQRVQEVPRLHMRVVSQQQLQRAPVRALAFGQVLEPCAALRLRQVHDLVEQRRNHRPVLRVKFHRLNILGKAPGPHSRCVGRAWAMRLKRVRCANADKARVRSCARVGSRYLSAANNSVRALSQSRRTVRAVTPIASAISASLRPPK